MILGAGIYQVPLIRTARRMGLYTIVVSIPGDYPGFALADKIYELNTRDKEAILAAAEKEQIDGILAALEREDVVEPLCGLAHGHVAVLRAESRSSLRLIWREIRRFECLKVCHVSHFE